MEQKNSEVVLNGDKEVQLGQMRDYLLEWYQNGIAEHITKFDEVYFEDYDRGLLMRDAVTEEEIFRAIFHRYQTIDDSSIVYLSGVVNKELRGIIGKMIELDEQIKAEEVKSTKETQKGE